MKLLAFDFEVFGKVQGVFFRKYTKLQCEKLGLSGWCMNTEQGTVIGHIEGLETFINQMKQWLRKEGSPKSTIEKVIFKHEQEISVKNFSDFEIRK